MAAVELINVDVGVALRRCSDTGDWNVSVDISNCSSESFVDLENMAVSS